MHVASSIGQERACCSGVSPADRLHCLRAHKHTVAIAGAMCPWLYTRYDLHISAVDERTGAGLPLMCASDVGGELRQPSLTCQRACALPCCVATRNWDYIIHIQPRAAQSTRSCGLSSASLQAGRGAREFRVKTGCLERSRDFLAMGVIPERD